MSRTPKRGKGCGFEYWSKRPNSCSPPGKKSKQITNRIERRRRKDATKKEPRDDEA